MQRITKQISFIAFFKLETSNKILIIQNESIYVCMKYHSNQSLFTHLSLPSLTVILIFTVFICCFSKYLAEPKQ